MHPEFAPVAFLSAFSLFLPLPWHWRAHNVATFSMIGWLFALNVISGVNAIIWAGNIDLVAFVWCDVTTKLTIGVSFALPAACFCICMHLEQVSSGRIRSTFIAERLRRLLEAAMCLRLHLVFMLLHFIVQDHRYDIIEDYGCRPTTYFSIPAILIVWAPPILLSLGALVFAALSLRYFIARRLTFAAHLSSSSSALTTPRYLRLMAMSTLQMFWSLAITCFTLWFTVTKGPLRRWTDWSDVHSDYWRVDRYPSTLTPPRVLRLYNAILWLNPLSTVVFVAFFSFWQDAIEEYKKCISWITTRVFRVPTSRDHKPHMKPSRAHLSISHPTLVASSTFISESHLTPMSSIDNVKKYLDSVDASQSLIVPALSYTNPRATGNFIDLASSATPSTAVVPCNVIHIKYEMPPSQSLNAPPSTLRPHLHGQASVSSFVLDCPVNQVLASRGDALGLESGLRFSSDLP